MKSMIVPVFDAIGIEQTVDIPSPPWARST